jgi:hypothetical protein
MMRIRMSLLGKTEHQWADESLSAYIDGELSPGESARVEKHLQECRACGENLATLRQTVGLLRELPVLPAPRSFAVRPVAARAKPARAAPSWGYGLLKGATAMAALMLVLLFGGDLALNFVGPSLGFPAAQAPEVAWAPSLEPGLAPAPSEDQPMLGIAKETELPPGDVEEMAPALPEPTQAADAYQTVLPEGSPPAGMGAGPPADTPTVSAAPTEAPAEETQDLGAGGEEVTPPPEGTPVPSAVTEPEGPSAEPSPAVPPAEEDGQRAEVSLPTPEAVAMAEAAETGQREQEEVEKVAGVFALSPLRLAELTVLAVLLVLAVTTALTAWRRRQAS